MGKGAAVGDALLHGEMSIGHGGQLGQMGDAQHLLGAADAGHLLRHLLSGPAGDAGIHLVKDHGAYPILLRQNVLHGQHDAGQLAAGGDLLDGTQFLAHVGGHEEAHGVHSGLRQGLGLEVDGEADAAHIQLAKLREDLLLQPLCRLMAGLGQLLRRRLGSSQGLLLQLLQVQQGVAGVLDGVQLLGAAVQIGQHTLYIRAILLFQPVQLIQTALHLVQLLRGEVEGIPLVLHSVGQIVDLAVHRLQPLVQLLEAVVQTTDGLQSALGLPQQGQCAAGAVVAAEAEVRLGDGGHEFFAVAQQVAAGGQFLLLTGPQLGPLKLLDLVAQGIHAAGLLCLVHLQGVHLATDIRQLGVFLPIGGQQRLGAAEAIQIQQVLLLVQQLLAVVLTVDVQQAAAQGTQLRHRDGAAAHPADVFTVGVDLPLQQQLLIPCNAQVLPYLRRDAGEAGADVGLVGPGADQVTGGALTQHGAQRVNDDGFTGAGLAGEGVEARLKGDIRPVDDGDIFDMEQFQHLSSLRKGAASAQHLLDLVGKLRRCGVVTQHQQNGVVPRQRPHQIGNLHAVQRSGGTVGQTRHGLDDHQILGVVHAEDALPEDGTQTVGKVQLCPMGGHGIAVAALPYRLLDEVQLLDVP